MKARAEKAEAEWARIRDSIWERLTEAERRAERAECAEKTERALRESADTAMQQASGAMLRAIERAEVAEAEAAELRTRADQLTIEVGRQRELLADATERADRAERALKEA